MDQIRRVYSNTVLPPVLILPRCAVFSLSCPDTPNPFYASFPHVYSRLGLIPGISGMTKCLSWPLKSTSSLRCQSGVAQISIFRLPQPFHFAFGCVPIPNIISRAANIWPPPSSSLTSCPIQCFWPLDTTVCRLVW